MPSAILAVKIIGDASSAKKALEETDKAAATTESRIEKFNNGMKKATIPAAAVGAALVAMGTDAFNAASELEQAKGAVEAVFGQNAASMQQLAAHASQNVGLAESEYSQLSSVIGSQLKNMGVSMTELGPQTNTLIGLGADLSAQFGGSTSDAVAALSSLLRGERDPIEKYGVSIKQADIEAQKAKMGLAGLTGEAAKSADTQATLALLTQQTASAQGAFGREANTAAGQQQRANAEWENAKAALGQSLLPVVSAAAQQFAGLANWVRENSGLVGTLATIVGILTVSVLAYNAGVALAPIATGAATAAQWLWNAAMSANPLGLIIIAIGIVITLIASMIKNWNAVAATAASVWASITGWVSAAGKSIADAWNSTVKWLSDGWNGFAQGISAGINSLVGWFLAIPNRIGNFFRGIELPGWVTNLVSWLGFSAVVTGPELITAAATPMFPSFQTRGGFASTQSGETYITHITVNGAIDKDATARQIRDILNSDARRRGVIGTGQVVIA